MALLRWLLAGAWAPLALAGLDPFSSSHLTEYPCVSLFHRNGRQGCSTQEQKQSGLLYYFDGNAAPDDVVVVLEDYFLTAQYITMLQNTQGIIVLNSTSQDFTFKSPASQTPNAYGTPSANLDQSAYAWNARGQDLLDMDLYGLPISFIADSDQSQALREEAQNADSKTLANFRYYMGPAEMTSPECLAWIDQGSNEWNPKCLPLGGSSVWASAGSPPSKSRPVVVVGAGMDATSLFHDLVPGANAAASNILTVLMAAKLIGANVNDKTLDNLTNRIVFALFQGETYGYIGSRAFFKDLAGFQCNGNPVSPVAGKTLKEFACLDPLRPSLNFAMLGNIVGMIAVDQISHPVGAGVLYAHSDNDSNYGAFLANLLKYDSTSSVTVAATSVNDGSLPPTPLTSMKNILGVGGTILTGYDYAFPTKPAYHSHMDTADVAGNMESMAAAATIIARTALAAAYDSGDYDYQTAGAYAANLIPELSVNDETFVALYDCLFVDGQCSLFQKYSKAEVEAARYKTGLSLNVYDYMPKQPNYYVGVYNGFYGQPFVQVGDSVYGAYDGDKYGNKQTDAFGVQPSQLEAVIHGLFNDFLGRGAAKDGVSSCKRSSDCSNVGYCSSYGPGVCSGSGECVCSRANYHQALDESLVATPGKATGYFSVSENDAGVSAMYTEPYWSSSVGVRVYSDAGPTPGLVTLGVGLVVGAISMFAAFVMRIGLKKEKLY